MTRPAIVLVQPRIPGNVGAVGRLCAATRSELHVVRPIPFELSDASLRRAGLDYLNLLNLQVHMQWDDCRQSLAGRRLWLLTSSGTQNYFDIKFNPSDVLVFGSETDGVSEAIRSELAGSALRLPMPESRARCLNLATSAAIALYELLRQTGSLQDEVVDGGSM